MSKYTIETESRQTTLNMDAITAETLDVIINDAYIYIYDGTSDSRKPIFSGFVADAVAAIEDWESNGTAAQ